MLLLFSILALVARGSALLKDRRQERQYGGSLSDSSATSLSLPLCTFNFLLSGLTCHLYVIPLLYWWPPLPLHFLGISITLDFWLHI